MSEIFFYYSMVEYPIFSCTITTKHTPERHFKTFPFTCQGLCLFLRHTIPFSNGGADGNRTRNSHADNVLTFLLPTTPYLSGPTGNRTPRISLLRAITDIHTVYQDTSLTVPWTESFVIDDRTIIIGAHERIRTPKTRLQN